MKSLKLMFVAVTAIVFLLLGLTWPVEAKTLSKERRIEKISVLTTTAAYDLVRYEMGRTIVEAWKKLGVNASLEAIDYKAGIQRTLRSKRFDTFIIHWGAKPERIDPDIFLYHALHSSNSGETGWNITGFQNPEYDELVEAQRKEMDIQKRQKLVWKAQEVYFEHQPHNILINEDLFFAYNKKTFKDPILAVGNPITNFWSDISFTPITEQKYLRQGYPADLKVSNPLALATLEGHYVMRHVYDSLIRIGWDGEPKPWAAESFKIVDNVTVDITLRDGMKWHDGKPVTVKDVKFSFDYLKEWKAAYYLSFLEPLDSVEILDSKRVRFRLKYPFAPFILNTLGQIYLIPRHIWANLTDREAIKDPNFYENPHPIGSGPFKWGYWKKGEMVKLDAFREHFHPPKADGFMFVVYGSKDAMVGGFEKGEIDVTGFYLRPYHVRRLEQTGFAEFPPSANFGFYNIHYNCRKPPFNDMIFRRALSMAISHKEILETIFEGKGVLTGTMICPPNKFWHNPNIPPFPEDSVKARETLKRAGYEWDDEGNIYYPAPENDRRKIDILPVKK